MTHLDSLLNFGMIPLQGKLHDTKTGKAGAIASGKVLSTEALSEHLLQIMKGGALQIRGMTPKQAWGTHQRKLYAQARSWNVLKESSSNCGGIFLTHGNS